MSALRAFPAKTGTGRRPAVLVIPGGSYSGISPSEGEPYARWLAGLGIHAFVLEYPVAPARYPEALREARRALAEIRSGEHALDLDPTRVGALGSSAGGHLAASAGSAMPTGDPVLDRERPDFTILCYPVISFLAGANPRVRDNLLGESPSAALVARTSVELHLDEATPPTFAWFSTDDPIVDVANSWILFERLARFAPASELHVFPVGGHGLGMSGDVPHAAQWRSLCERWLALQGVLDDPGPRTEGREHE